MPLRDRALTRAGYTLLRLPNGIVFEDPDAFVRKVVKRAETLPNFFTGEVYPLTPGPSSRKGARGEENR
jgi:hypothetical protein